MADNLTLNAGSGGSTLATDDITDAGGAHYQRVKLTDGTANSETHVHTGNGTSANALRVTVSSDSTGVLSVDDNGGALTVDNAGTFAVQEDGAALTALQLIDDVVHTDDAAFTLGTSKGVMMMGFAGTQSVNANDAGAIAMETDGSVHIHDGGNSITVDGTVTANLSATDNTVLDNIDTNTDYGQVVGGGVEATALRVTLASDSTGLLSVDDNGGSLTVDNGGTFAVQVDAALPAGTNAIGKLAANSGVDIGDVDVTSLDGVAAEGAALGNGILIQGDDGTDRKNINVDPTTGDVQVDVTNTVTVDGSGVTQPVSGTVTANLSATDNAVLDDIAAKLAPNTTNGVTPYLNQDTSAIATVKSGAGTVYWITCMSIDATPVYLNLYDSTTAVLGTTTPTNQFIVPTQGDANGAGFTMNFGPLGIQYSTGIQVAAATTFNGSTDPGTNVVITNIGYE